MAFKRKYYDLTNIESYDAQYNVVISERSNGKTYAVLERIIKRFFQKGEQGAIIRRWAEDFKGKRGVSMFNALIENGLVEKYSNGTYDSIYYYSGRWFFAKKYETDKGETKLEKMDEPFCYAFALTEMEHDKSTSYPKIETILLDEFLARSYIPDEFILFMNVISTIVRLRKTPKIFMMGNTISHYCPYFDEMGLKHIKQMRQGSIDIYTYDKGLKVAVEYCNPMAKDSKESNVYFAFDNPRLKMITEGSFEILPYPHLPEKYKPNEIMFTYFIEYDKELFQCEMIATENLYFTYIHRKTTPIQDNSKDLIYSLDITPTIYHRKNILIPIDKIGQKILQFFKDRLVFYQDNEVGETINMYIETCKKE